MTAPGFPRFLSGPDPEEELDEELTFHFERTVAELIETGLSRTEAEEEARRRFGDVASYRRRIGRIDRRRARTKRWGEVWEGLRQVAAVALRRIRRAPGFTAAVVLTLALGIGANTTMFGVIDRLLLSPPDHVVAPDRLVNLHVRRISPFTGQLVTSASLTYPDFLDFRKVDAFDAVAAFAVDRLTLGSGADAERIRVQMATAELFPTLGVEPHRGRFFEADEDRLDGGQPVAVLAHGFWQRRFGGDPSMLGRDLVLGSGRYTVIGVAPPGFTGAVTEPVDVWLPLRTAGVLENGDGWIDARRWYWLRGVARLREGTTRTAARAEATAAHVAGRQTMIEAGAYDENASVVLGSLVPGRGPDPGREVAVSRWLAGVSLLVLLIACANVANLLLVRAARRRRELAVRVALGISRRRLLGELLGESVVLAGLGTFAALAAARWGGALVYRTLLPEVDPGGALWSPRLLGFAGLTGLATAVLAGLPPALRASRPDLRLDLREGGRTVSGVSRLRSGLLVGQVALSTVLLVGAGLFVRSLQRAHSVDLGFEPEGIVLASAETMDGSSFGTPSVEVVRRARDRLVSLPGVADAAVVGLAPFQGRWGKEVALPDQGPVSFVHGPYFYPVSEGYLELMRFEIVEGRSFRADDFREGAPPVAVLSRDMARKLYGRSDPVGRCLLVGDPENGPHPCSTVVGVADNPLTFGLEQEASHVYFLPLAHPEADELPATQLVVRATGRAEELVPTVRRAILDASPDVRYASVTPLTDHLTEETRAWRLGATLFTLFGLLALVVAALGLYSVVAFDVADRRRELGIRSAVGASRRRLVGLVFRQTLAFTAVGVAAGLAAAVLGAPYAGEVLFEVSPVDPLVYGGVAASLAVVATAAALVPARRVTRIDPSEALRSE